MEWDWCGRDVVVGARRSKTFWFDWHWRSVRVIFRTTCVVARNVTSREGRASSAGTSSALSAPALIAGSRRILYTFSIPQMCCHPRVRPDRKIQEEEGNHLEGIQRTWSFSAKRTWRKNKHFEAS